MKIPRFVLGLLLLLARSVFASERDPPDEDKRGKKKLDIPNQKRTPELGGTMYFIVFNDGSAPATMALTRTGLADVLVDSSVMGFTSGGGCDDCFESGRGVWMI